MRVPVLERGECERVVADVHRLRKLWIERREPPCSFFTLGPASYLDCPQGELATNGYLQRAVYYNDVLARNFPGLYRTVREAVAGVVGADVAYSHQFALPGFHIWLAAAVCTRPVASVHFDLQYRHLSWSAVDAPDFSQVLSFTLPLKLPEAGGGLWTWDLTYQEFLEAREKGFVDTVAELQRFKQIVPVAYRIGEAVVHSGHMLHQIAPVASVVERDERITLQGHALRCRNGWQLYW